MIEDGKLSKMCKQAVDVRFARTKEGMYHRYRDTRLNFHFSKFLFSEIKRGKNTIFVANSNPSSIINYPADIRTK